MVFWAFIDVVLLKDSPDAAGFDKFDTHDASHGETEKNYTYKELMKKIFSNKIIWTIGIIEFTSGILRNGVLQWYKVFAKVTRNYLFLGESHCQMEKSILKSF